MGGIGKRPLLTSSTWRNELDIESQPQLASGRVVLIGNMEGDRGYNNHLILVDKYQRHIDKTSYDVLSRLAETPNEEVTYGQLIESVYGWEDPSPRMIASFKKPIWSSIHRLRHELGEALGDRESGVIRNVKDIGYLALSTFD